MARNSDETRTSPLSPEIRPARPVDESQHLPDEDLEEVFGPMPEVHADRLNDGDFLAELLHWSEDWYTLRRFLDSDRALSQRPINLFPVAHRIAWQRLVEQPSQESGRVADLESINELIFEFGMLIAGEGYWSGLSRESNYSLQLQRNLLRCFDTLEEKDRIRTLSTFLSRLVELRDAGHTVLLEEDIQSIMSVVYQAYERVGVEKSLLTEPKRFPKERWRESRPEETAEQYFNRVIEPTPYLLRLNTSELAEWDPDLFRVLAVQAAHHERTLTIQFPSGPSKVRTPPIRTQDRQGKSPPSQSRFADVSSYAPKWDPETTGFTALQHWDEFYARSEISQRPYLGEVQAYDRRFFEALRAILHKKGERLESYFEAEPGRARGRKSKSFESAEEAEKVLLALREKKRIGAKIYRDAQKSKKRPEQSPRPKSSRKPTI